MKIKTERPYNRTKSLILGPFSRRHKVKSQLALEPIAVQLVAKHIVMSDDRRLLFVQNSKAGCTSVSHLIYEYSRGQKFGGKIHGRESELIRGEKHWPIVSAALDDPDVYKFTMVRDPVARAISGFLNFFVDWTNKNATKYETAIRKLGYQDKGDLSSKFDAYLSLIEASFAISKDYTDPHFRTQVRNTGFGTVQYNQVCKLENFSVDVAMAFAAVGMKISADDGRLARKENASRSVRFVPDMAQTARIRELYGEDFETFEY